MFFAVSTNLSAATNIKTATPVEDSTKLLKGGKKFAKILKSIFHHNDSVKQAHTFIHEHHRQLKRDKVPTFSTGLDSVTPVTISVPENFELDYEVFGFYPHWEKDYYKQLNFSLLTTVAYFSYEVNPKTGHPNTVHDWETTALVDAIRKHPNKELLLTVSNFGQHNNSEFLKNKEAVDVLTTNLITLLNKRNADGVCIDFEGVPKSSKSDYTSFLITLSNRLKAANSNYKIYVTVPSVNWAQAIDFKAIEQTVHRFIIMGYDYYGKPSKVAGPVAPLKSGKTWEPYNLTNSVDYYIQSGIPSSKIILALPIYGTVWETQNLDIKSKVKTYVGARTLSYIKSAIENNETTYIDPISKSAYNAYALKGKPTTYRQCWYENDSSFVYKTQLIKTKKLKGLGLWALGYDKGYTEIWDVIRKEMAKPKDTATTAKDSTSKNSIISSIVKTLGLADPDGKINKTEAKLVSITNYKTILLYTMCFLLCFAGLGFIIAILSPNTRNKFFNDNTIKAYYITGVLISIVVIFRMLNWINDGLVLLIIGFTAGAFTYYFVNKYIQEKQKDLP